MFHSKVQIHQCDYLIYESHQYEVGLDGINTGHDLETSVASTAGKDKGAQGGAEEEAARLHQVKVVHVRLAVALSPQLKAVGSTSY